MPTRVASVNLKFTLTDAQFEAGLREVLRDRPDLVALQEAGRNRDRIIERVAASLDYAWTRPKSPNGDPTMPVMWLDRRFRLRSCKAIRLARREFVGHLPGRKSRLPASWATEVVLETPDRDQVVVLNFHLTAEVQLGAGYRKDNAHRLRVQRHRSERRRLARRARMHRKRGRRVFAAGDSNFHGFRLFGFVSSWQDRRGGTLQGRAVDVVLADEKPTRLWTVETSSDHDALVVTYP